MIIRAGRRSYGGRFCLQLAGGANLIQASQRAGEEPFIRFSLSSCIIYKHPVGSDNSALVKVICVNRRLLCALSFCVSAFGTTVYVDDGAPSQSLGTAQLVNTMPGGTPLDEIVGTLSPGVAILYEIYLPDGITFSATTTFLANPANPTAFDTELFLFNSTGLGVYANDDDPNAPPQSTLPTGDTFSPTTSGIYYLAIAGAGYLPVSSGNAFIFPVSGGLLSTSGVNAIAGPTGPGGASPLSGWSSTSNQAGDFEIDLTGAEFLPSATPEPATLLFVGGGLLAVALRRKLVR
jgi:hypothetical protein